MANITTPRDAIESAGVNFYNPVKAGEKLIKGAAYGLDASGWAVNMETGVVASAQGIVQKTVDNTDGANGDLSVEGRSGVYLFHILGSSALVAADEYGHPVVYFQDNHTVAKSSNGGARPAAGRFVRLEGSYAAVAVGPQNSIASPDGDLVAANNLSDVVSAATARANIGANKGELCVLLPSLVADVFYIPLPDRAVTITKLKIAITDALTGADLVVTPAINATNITDGAITVTQAGSAAGNQAEATPSAANVSDGADEILRLTLSGNTAAVSGILTVEYTW